MCHAHAKQFPPIKLTYAHSYSFPFFLPSMAISCTPPTRHFFTFYCSACLHKFCNIFGLCLQLANALKSQIYIFSPSFSGLNNLVSSLLLSMSHYWICMRVEGPVSLLFQMFSRGHLRMQAVDSTLTLTLTHTHTLTLKKGALNVGGYTVSCILTA